MRKILLVLMLALALTGCKDKENKQNESITSTQAVKKTFFEFKTGNGLIKVNMTAKDALAIAGEYKEYVEIPSCVYTGYDKMYIYGGYEINVNTIDGEDVVTRIILTDDSVTTKEGLFIGDSVKKMKSLYGTSYVLDEGIYEYSKDDGKLYIGVRDDAVISIEYRNK